MKMVEGSSSEEDLGKKARSKAARAELDSVIPTETDKAKSARLAREKRLEERKNKDTVKESPKKKASTKVESEAKEGEEG